MPHDLRSLQRLKHVRNLCFIFLGAVYSFQVGAQAALDQSAYDRFMWTVTGGNQQTVNYGGGGQPVVGPAGTQMPIEPATSTGSDVGYSGNGTKTNPSGNKVPVKVTAKVLGTAAAKIIGAGVGAIGVIAAGKALWDLCNELGYSCSGGGSTPPVISKPQTTAVYCVYNGQNVCGRYSSAAAACSGLGTGVWRVQSGITYCLPTQNPAYPQANTSQTAQTAVQTKELEDLIASRTTGWPTTSTIHKAIEEAAKATGQAVPLVEPKITGPATSSGTSKTTSDPAAGTTTTTNTTHNHIYNDNRVSTTTTTSVNVTNNNSGQSTTTTTTEQPIEEETDCQKNPQSLNCSDLDTPSGDIPKTTKLITFAPENLGFAGGSCPANVVQNIAGKPVTVVNWSQNCGYITSYAKPMILAMATFAALMIIFVGKPE